MVVRMRHTRAHRDNRRSHHALKEKNFLKCEKCGSLRMPHVMCDNCGTYKGRVVIDLEAKRAKAEEKAKKAKAGPHR